MGDALRDRPAEFWEHQEASITVSDSTGLILFRLDLTSLLAAAILPPSYPV